MISCNHSELELLPEKKNRLRCRHCHLSIEADELGDGYCPECFEMQGKKRYDFEEMDTVETGTARYRCEECGIIIETESRKK
jgi:rubrerythrin